MDIDNFNIQDRKYQYFADGQSAFHEHVEKNRAIIAVLDITGKRSFPDDYTLRKVESVLLYKRYTWKEPWNKTWAPYINIHYYSLEPIRSLPEQWATISSQQAYHSIIIQFHDDDSQKFQEIVRLIEEAGSVVYIYRRDDVSDAIRNDIDIGKLLHHMWSTFVPVYVDVIRTISASHTYGSEDVVTLFHRIIRSVTDYYNEAMSRSTGHFAGNGPLLLL